MESKRAKYILGFSLLAIWSLLFMRVRERVNKQNDFAIVDQIPKSKLNNVSNEYYELLLSYADPFQIGMEVKRKPTRQSKPVKNKAAKKVEKKPGRAKAKKATPKKRPDYIYKGYIVVKGGKRVALVSDGVQNYNLEVGGKIEASTLTRIFEDSIQVKVEEQYLTYLKIN